MAGRKWNNQGGSSRDGFDFRPKKTKQQPNIPTVEDLRESIEVSFRLTKPSKPKPNYGQFGDEIWTAEPYIVEPEIVVPEIEEPELPGELQELRIPRADPATRSIDIVPYLVQDEYELVVKYPGGLVLRISSGQAYAARNQINDMRFDLCLVIDSSAPISIDNAVASKINTISLSKSSQNPIFSLYNWLLTKISIATDYSAKQPDPVLSKLQVRSNTVRLPTTQFVANSIVCDLFYSSGVQPKQICLNATNKVLLYESSKAEDDRLWAVTFAGKILPLCLNIDKLPIVSIAFKDGGLQSIEAGSGGIFTIRVSLDVSIATSIAVKCQLSGTANNQYYSVNGITTTGSESTVTIPANADYFDVTIEPLDNPNETQSKTIIITLLPDTANYALKLSPDELNFVTATILPKPAIKPLVAINFTPSSPHELVAGKGSFFMVLSRDVATSSGLNIDLELMGDAIYSEYLIDDNPVATNLLTVAIPQNQLTKTIKITPTTDTVYPVNRSIVVGILGSTRYTITKQTETAIILYPRPIVTMGFAPGSPTGVNPGNDLIYMRVTFDRVWDVDIPINFEISGTAPTSDYDIFNMDEYGSTVSTMLAGDTYFDLIIRAYQNSTQANETIDIKAIAGTGYLVGTPNLTTGTIFSIAAYIASIDYAPNTPHFVVGGSGTLQVRITLDRPTTADLFINCILFNTPTTTYAQWTSNDFVGGWSQFPIAKISAGQSLVNLSISSLTVNQGIEDKQIDLRISPDGSAEPLYLVGSPGLVSLIAVTNPRFKNIVLKYVSKPNPEPINGFSNGFVIYASNTLHSTMPIEKNSSPGLPTDLIRLGSVDAVVQDPYPTDPPNLGIVRSNIDLNALTQLNDSNYRYIYSIATKIEYKINSPLSEVDFGTVGLQRSAKLESTRDSVFENPYYLDDGLNFGWIDIVPTDLFTLTTSTSGAFYYAHWGFCIRIDTQNLQSMSFIEIIASLTDEDSVKAKHNSISIH